MVQRAVPWVHHLWCLGFVRGAGRPFWEVSLLFSNGIYFGTAGTVYVTFWGSYGTFLLCLSMAGDLFCCCLWFCHFFLPGRTEKIGCEITPTPAAAIRAINPSSSASVSGVWCNATRSLCHSFQLQVGGGQAGSVHLVSRQSGQIPRVHNARSSVGAWFGAQWNSPVVFATVPSAPWSTRSSCSPQAETCCCQQSLELQVFGKRSPEFLVLYKPVCILLLRVFKSIFSVGLLWA